MSSAHSEYDDADFDDSLFPAYAKYINGVETPWYEPHDRRLNYLPYTDAGPIPYTNSMPSRQVTGTPANFNIRNGPSVLDLRLSSNHPQLGRLVPPETLRSAPPRPRTRAPAQSTPGSTKHHQAVSSAEITRQKLLQASLERSGATTPPMLVGRNGSSEKRRMPARQATHPSLLRSSSATDKDSQAGIMPPSGRPLPSFAASPTPVRPQAHLSPQEPRQSGQLPSTALIRPGEILSDPRYKDAPRSNLKRIDTQITGLYDIAQGHPDPEFRRQALIEIAASSAKIHRMVFDRDQQLGKMPPGGETRKQAHAQAQYSQYRSAQSASPHDQPQGFSDGYEQAMPSPQYEAQVLPQQHIQSMPHQAPVQQLPQQYAHPEPENLLPNTPPNISGDLRGTINAQISKYIQSCSLLAASPADPEGAARRNAAQNWQNDFRAFLPPAGLQYLDETVAKILSYHPVQAAQPHLAPQVCPHPSMPSHQNVPSHPYAPDQAGVIAEPLRRYIFATLPKYFGAVRARMLPSTPANAALQQQAHAFMQRFRATVPNEGHDFIDEIVRRMIIERNEGRDPMALLQI
ncbi:hypothetical protein HBH52_075720 [Parastagonospora nodorum]|nr:hypothetical protein HBH52_075720 [Parastagonospora nodorum]